ncbi:MAG: hypothetical protein ACRDN8_02045, partial [Thermoleophilaceae bacterium]
RPRTPAGRAPTAAAARGRAASWPRPVLASPTHHRRYDRGQLDLLSHLEPRYRAELAHGLMHLGLLRLRRLTATRWAPASAQTPDRKDR